MKQEVYAEYKAEQFLSRHLPVAEHLLVKRVEDIKMHAPLVLKISSPELLHKSDVGGVEIVRRDRDIAESFAELEKTGRKLKIKLDGILVQKFLDGEEILIGIKKDDVFGHVIVLGLGGIFAEVLKDTSIRKCPIDEDDAQEMIDELKGRDIFYGARGKKLNSSLLRKIMVKVSHLPQKYKKIEELDINPFILNEKEGSIADARIIFST